MTKLSKLISSNLNIIILFGLGVLFYIIFFHNIGTYPLMDVDESRYVTMAKDMFKSKEFFTLYLNNEYFFEKPPLYFWCECLSFKLFGKINEFTARFPLAVYGTACCYLVYFIGKKIVSIKYGIISSIILATSLEFVILSKFAILDIVISACITFSLFLGIIVYFCRERRRKYYWWLFYMFSGFAVMAKGIPGVVIPFGSMFVIALLSNKLRDIFRPIYIIPGIILFLLITLPWHIIMFKSYNPIFWDEYIIKHHFARFVGDKIINREQPFYFYFITLLWGFFPWCISTFILWGKRLINLLKLKKIEYKYSNFNLQQRFILFNLVIVLFVLLFFSLSGTKLITYILPIYPPLACLAGFVWYDYIERKTEENLINKTSYFLGGLFILTSFLALLTPLYLPKELLFDISSSKTFCILTPFAVGLSTILFTKRKLYWGSFISLALFIAMFSAFATEKFFEIDYKFGQDDLMKFAKYAKENNCSITTFNFGHKYSLLYYGETPVTFGTQLEPKDLERTLDKDNNLVIIRLKDIKHVINKDFAIIDIGRKYALIKEQGDE